MLGTLTWLPCFAQGARASAHSHGSLASPRGLAASAHSHGSLASPRGLAASAHSHASLASPRGLAASAHSHGSLASPRGLAASARLPPRAPGWDLLGGLLPFALVELEGGRVHAVT